MTCKPIGEVCIYIRRRTGSVNNDLARGRPDVCTCVLQDENYSTELNKKEYICVILRNRAVVFSRNHRRYVSNDFAIGLIHFNQKFVPLTKKKYRVTREIYCM